MVQKTDIIRVEQPLVSVIVIGLKEEDFEAIKLHLSRQKFRDFELITEVGGTIPAAWNRAIKKAKGKYLVFTETDVRPLSEYWLDELVKQMNSDDLVVKGMEVVGTPWNLCNLIVRREVFEKTGFDERFLWAEDTDFFSRLLTLSYRLEKKEVAHVFHGFDPTTSKALKRAFHYGINWMRIRYRYIHPIEKATFKRLFLQSLIPLIQIMGMIIGFFRYWPERRYRSQPETFNIPHPLEKRDEEEPSIGLTGNCNSPENQIPLPRSIRVLYISPFPPTRSGIASYAHNYRTALEDQTTEVELMSFPEVNSRPCSLEQIVQEITKLHHFLRDWMPDILHIELGYGLLREFYLLLSLPRERPYQIIVTVHDPPCLAGEPLRFIGDGNEDLEDRRGIIGPAAIRDYSFQLEKKAYSHADLIMVLSKKGCQALEKQFGAHKGLRVFPHGTYLPPPRENSTSSDPGRLLYFGFLHPDKGIDVLLEALQLLPERSVKLEIAGAPYRLTLHGTEKNEAYQDQLRAMSRDERLRQKVTFRGYIPEAELNSVFGYTDLLILPYRESLIASVSGVLLQGMAFGLPIICTEVRALSELIKHGQTGWLVPPNDPGAIAEAILYLLKKPQLRQSLGNNARQLVQTKYTWATVGAKAKSIYLELVQPGGNKPPVTH